MRLKFEVNNKNIFAIYFVFNFKYFFQNFYFNVFGSHLLSHIENAAEFKIKKKDRKKICGIMGSEQTTQKGPKINVFSIFFYSHQGAMK